MVEEQNREERLNQLLPEIEKVAKQLAKKYVSIPYDDIRQDLCLYAWENIDKIKTYGEEGGNPLLVFTRHGNKVCGKWLASATVRTDEYYYSPGEVRGLLSNGALWVEQDDILGRSDLLMSFKKLDKQDREVLAAVYFEGQPIRSSYLVGRAIEKLTMHMNKFTKPEISYV